MRTSYWAVGRRQKYYTNGVSFLKAIGVKNYLTLAVESVPFP